MIIFSGQVIFNTLAWFNRNQKTVINLLRALYQESKNKTSIIILAFGIWINANFFKISLLPNKLQKIMIFIASNLLKDFLILAQTSSFTGYLLFFIIVV